MSRPRMRPSFRVRAACPAETLRSVIETRLALDAEDVEGDLSAEHGVLRIPEEKRQFFTPCLDLTIEQVAPSDEGDGRVNSHLWGTFSPRAEIWTAFVFTIGTLVIVGVFATMIGLAQLALGHAPYALLVPFAAVAVAALLHVSALVGQGLSISDMYRLRAFVDDCLRQAEGEAEDNRSRKCERGAEP